MLDLETLGTHVGAPILTIGAVLFDPNGDTIISTFRRGISLKYSLMRGFTINDDTFFWWLQQSEAARTSLLAAQRISYTPEDALKEFSDWVYDDGHPGPTSPKEILMWGNGAAFDNALLTEYYRRCSVQPQPWQHFNDRCYRTFKNQFPDVKLERYGTYHDPVDDAISQAKHVQTICRLVRDGHQKPVL